MKKLGTFLLCLLAGIFIVKLELGLAKIVSYVDETGRLRYVNTDYSKVPEKYLEQVQNQLKEQAPVVNALEAVAPGPTAPLEPETPLVEIFVRTNCDECRKLEQALQGNRIPFHRYDVDYHPLGIAAYREIGGELPIARINSQVFRGSNIREILRVLNKMQKTASAQP